MKRYYWSDTHFDHLAAISVFQRPFGSLQEMQSEMEMHLHRVLDPAAYGLDREPGMVFHLGDVAINLRGYIERGGSRLAEIMKPEANVLVVGNHDGLKSSSGQTYRQLFGEIVGEPNAWQTNTLIVEDVVKDRTVKVLLSHFPQRNLRGCDYNLYGHIHNGFARDPGRVYTSDLNWLSEYQFPQHMNVSVELIGYRPRTLEELIYMQQKLMLQLL